ncbi:DUF3368 domain-containing protein [Persephonella sp. KM09-Lau-8]|uniref:DUF3368 domain-containing protein n=1 Tax=Persephonella sp. KM09-Lau-8 TaxID=1158345 RepID=UPI000495AD17|nr:DUF3368 domain-containing protein [Persephonella sp. KM09-Lau-8]
MPKVVSNTTPILSFIKLNRLDILRNIYKEITIPEAVYRELEEGKHKYYLNISKEDWIKISKVSNKRLVKQFEKILDTGEAEAITLALELKADLLLMDEKIGRKIAEEQGLKISGTIGILLKAKEEGIISEVKPFIYELIKKGNYYKKSFLETVLKFAKEI